MSKHEKAQTGALVYGGVPRANLMPPEVGIRRKQAAQRRSLLALGALVTVVTIAGVVASFLFAAAAEQRLADERRITEQLLATQLGYAEVTQLRADLQLITGVRTQIAEVEVLWADALVPYLGVLGPEVTVSNLTVLGNAPAQPPLGLGGPLRQERVATIAMTISTPDVPTPWVWLRAWERIDTYADASVDLITNADSGYTTTVTINLNPSALSGRYAAEDAATETNEEDQ